MHQPPPPQPYYAPPPAQPCYHCGQPVQPGAPACAWCHAPAAPPALVPAPYLPGRKNEALAVFLSFLFPGIGQFYAGNDNKGLLFLLLAIGNVILTFVFFIFTLGLSIFIGGPLGFGIWVWSMVDAYQEAQKYNARLLYGPGWR